MADKTSAAKPYSPIGIPSYAEIDGMSAARLKEAISGIKFDIDNAGKPTNSIEEANLRDARNALKYMESPDIKRGIARGTSPLREAGNKMLGASASVRQLFSGADKAVQSRAEQDISKKQVSGAQERYDRSSDEERQSAEFAKAMDADEKKLIEDERRLEDMYENKLLPLLTRAHKYGDSPAYDEDSFNESWGLLSKHIKGLQIIGAKNGRFEKDYADILKGVRS